MAPSGRCAAISQTPIRGLLNLDLRFSLLQGRGLEQARHPTHPPRCCRLRLSQVWIDCLRFSVSSHHWEGLMIEG